MVVIVSQTVTINSDDIDYFTANDAVRTNPEGIKYDLVDGQGTNGTLIGCSL